MSVRGELSGPGRVAHGYARTVVALRHVIVLGWAVALVALIQVPSPQRPAARLEGFVPEDSAAVRAEAASLDAFGFPLLSRTVVVQRDADGLSPYAQARAVLRALALTQGSYPDAKPLEGGLPVVNSLGIFPGTSERGTTAVTYLFARPDAGLGAQTRAARRLAREQMRPDDGYAGVTGSIPARVAQARILRERLPIMEVATLVVVVSIVGIYFRSLTAPLVALVTAGLAFFLALQTAARVGEAFAVTVPHELEPLILALVLGIVTDYSIFFLAGMRRQLAEGAQRVDAARAAAASTGPIVAVAAVTVAAGTGVLVVADSALFRAFGPAMALAVLVAALVSLTLVPALLAVLGRLLFWPSTRQEPPSRGLTRAVARQLTRRPVAAVLVGVCVLGLGAVGTAVRDLEPAVLFVPSLPPGTEVRVAASAAEEGFAPGILSPTVLLVQGKGVTSQRRGLARLREEVAAQPGVAGVVGPGMLPPDLERGVLLARSGNAARFLVVLADEPLGATAIGHLDDIAAAAPRLGQAAGLHGVRYGFGGDTALAGELVAMTRHDLGRIAVAALLANFVVLALFLRAIVAPVFLLASSVLALAAALGALVLFFQGVLGSDGITFYVPFASAVLLLSLGSDYNVFGVGFIWERARGLPLRQAVAEALPRTSAAISVAGITLAASFGMLAIVPLQPFRELAFVMVVGILVDALVVRSVLVPSVLSLVGPAAAWPRRMRPRGVRRSRASPPGVAAGEDLTESDDRRESPHE